MDRWTLRDDQSYTLCDDSELSSEYEFVPTPAESIHEETGLPYRRKLHNSQPDLRIEILEAPDKDGVLVSILPPQKPARDAESKIPEHVPCDIVLTIDVSGSMSAEAPPPVSNPEETERNGLTVLDLVKHAARTILETLDDTDRLAIVAFSTDAKTVQHLLPMTVENKVLTLQNINGLQPESMTNLWHGIMESIKVFEGDERPNCVPAIMILTDGLPNHMCPGPGYVRKIRSYKLPAALHTFGFGYSLRSGLLKSIAEVGGGNYAFIPDSGMLGTVFIHAVANMQSTFATRVSLSLTTFDGLTLGETMGSCVSRVDCEEHIKPVVEEACPVKVAAGRQSGPPRSTRRKPATTTLTFELDTLQYGQSRDIFFKYQDRSLLSPDSSILVRLEGRPVDGTALNIATHQQICVNEVSLATFAYHRSRAEICELLTSIFPLNSLEEHQVTTDMRLGELCAKVDCLANRIQSRSHKDVANMSLLEDLVGQNPSGQIRLALSTTDYFERWGKHYLLSVLNAHQKQICNSFKDTGPLQYGKNSPVFNQCRDVLDKAFDNLPPPAPSRPIKDNKGQQKSSRVDMRKYHRRDNPCFTGECRILMGNGQQLPVKDLKPDMEVKTRIGTAKVCAVVATKVKGAPISAIGRLRITPWHPILAGDLWTFPAYTCIRVQHYVGTVYSILLDRNANPDAHAVAVEGQWAATLGHGITKSNGDARAHAFLGDYDAVVRSLNSLPVMNGVLMCRGMRSNQDDGLVCGFDPAAITLNM